MSDIATPAAPSAPVPTQRTLTEPVKAGIREAYAKLQANTPGFATRRAQSQMIGLVSRALATSGGIGVAEAPTGVGKSLGYLTAGVPIALATDCNPGTCNTTSMPFVIALAVREMGMTPAEALYAATAGGAKALRRTDIGRVEVDAAADLAVLDAPSYLHLAYRPGVPLARALDL